jgi:hypothetical protein
MSKSSIDYASLGNVLYKRAYKLSEVRDQLETVAFDIVRFKDSDKHANLWQIQSADDGDYIVALYNDSEEKRADWEVSLSKTASHVQISYKGDPIVRVASSKLGLSKDSLDKVKDYLPEKLANNKKLVKALLNELDIPTKKDVLSKYPELT